MLEFAGYDTGCAILFEPKLRVMEDVLTNLDQVPDLSVDPGQHPFLEFSMLHLTGHEPSPASFFSQAWYSA